MEGEKFPIGLKVLVIDDDLAFLRILERLLINCKYNVTITTEPVKALEMLREDKNIFDIVILDVHMPMIDGLKLLEFIGIELDLPVIMLLWNDNPELVMKGVKHGAVGYLVKPVRQEELQYIWQYVVRKKMNKEKGKVGHDYDAGKYASFPLSVDGNEIANLEDARSRKRKEKKVTGDEEDKEYEYMDEDGDEVSNTRKKTRFVWSNELHKKFVDAIEQLGPENAFPKKITDFMNVDGLTRDSVSSHLQKYRLYLKKMNSLSNESTEETTATLGIQESSTYTNRVPLSNSFGMHGSLGNQISGLSSNASGYQALATNFRPNVGVPCLEDYTRKIGIWKNLSNPQQNVVHGNQLPSRSFNDISYVQNALENPFVQLSATPGCYFPPQNVGCATVESTPYNKDSFIVPIIDSSNQSFRHNSSLLYNGLFDYAVGHMNDVGTSSFVQNAGVHDNEVDALATLEDNEMHESTGMLADIVNEFLK